MWLLQAASYSSARKKYVDTGVIPQDVFEKLSDLDGSQNKKYLEFICYLYANKDVVDKVIKKWEFHFEYGTSFESQYHKVSFLFSDVLYLLERGGLKFNLDSLKSPESVLDFFEDCFRLIYKSAAKYLGLDRLKSEEDYKIVASGGIHLFSTNRPRYWFIVRVHNQPAANVIGSGTPWCVVPKGNEHWDGHYRLDTFNTFYVVYFFDHFIFNGKPREENEKYGIVWGWDSLKNPIDCVDSTNKKSNVERLSKYLELPPKFIRDTLDKNRIKRGVDFPKEVMDFIFFMKEYWKISQEIVDGVVWDKNSRTLRFPSNSHLRIDLGFLKNFGGFLFPDWMDFYLSGVEYVTLKGSGVTLESFEGCNCFKSQVHPPKIWLEVKGPIKIKSTRGVEHFGTAVFSECEIEVFFEFGCGCAFNIQNCNISKLGPSDTPQGQGISRNIFIVDSDFPWGDLASISFKYDSVFRIVVSSGKKLSLRGLSGDSKSVFQIRTNGEVDLGGAEFKRDLNIVMDPYKPSKGFVFRGNLGPIGGFLSCNFSAISIKESEQLDLTSWIPSYVGGNLNMATFSTKDFKFLSHCRVGGEVLLYDVNFMGDTFNFMGLETLIAQKLTIKLYSKITGIDFDHFPYQIPYISIWEKRNHAVHMRFVDDFLNSGVKEKYKGIFILNGAEV